MCLYVNRSMERWVGSVYTLSTYTRVTHWGGQEEKWSLGWKLTGKNNENNDQAKRGLEWTDENNIPWTEEHD